MAGTPEYVFNVGVHIVAIDCVVSRTAGCKITIDDIACVVYIL